MLWGQTNVHTFDFGAAKARGSCVLVLKLLHLIASYLPVFFAIGIMFVILYPTYFYFLDLVMLHSAQHPWWYNIFSVVIGVPVMLMIVSFVRTIFTPPGFVNQDSCEGLWAHRPKVVQSSERCNFHDDDHVASQLTREKELRYCTRCKVYKPDMAHHCGDCDRCVLRADHHCPWVNNCVGKHNAKFFNLFIFYIAVSGFAVSSSVFFVYKSESIGFLHGSVSPLRHAAIIGAAIGAFCIGIVFIIFSLSHCVMAATGSTSYSMARDTKVSGRANASLWQRLKRCLVDAGNRSKVVVGDKGPWWFALLPIAPEWQYRHPESEVLGLDAVV